MKTGLVIEGGILRSAFGAGVLKTWLDADVHFDHVVATGASALVGAYYHAGQGEALENMYGAYFDEVGEISRLFAAIGEDGLDGPTFVRACLEGYPLDMDAFCANTRGFAIATTNAGNGDGVIWPMNRYDKAKTVKMFLDAAVSMPGKNEAVSLVERSYYSGTISEPLPVHYLMDQGCEKVVVLSTHLKTYERKRVRLSALEALALRPTPLVKTVWQLSHIHEHEERARLLDLERKGQGMMVAPVVESTSYKRYGISSSAAAEFYSEGLRLGEGYLARVKRFCEEE